MRMKERDSLRWMAQIARPQLPALAALAVGTGAYAGCSVLFALFSRGILDAAVSGDGLSMLRYAAGLLVLIAVQMLLHLSVKWLEERTSVKLELAFRDRVFRALLGREYATVSKYHSGELLNRLFSDVGVVSSGVTNLLPSAVGLVTRLVCAVIVLLVIDLRFTAVLLAAGAAVFVVSCVFRDRLKSLHKQMQEKHGRVYAFLQETLENLLVVKVFGAEERMTRQAENLQGEYFRVRMRRRRLSVLANAGFGFLFQTGYLYALLWGGFGLLHGTLSYGSLLAILQLIGQVQTPFASLSGVLPQYYGIIASCERLRELEELDAEPPRAAVDAEKLYAALREIAFEDVSFGYDRERVLEHAQCAIPKGSLTAITGRSGHGKTTMLKLLLGIYPVDGGRIVFHTDGGEIPASAETRALFAYVPQGHLMFSGTIRENILFVRGSAPQNEIDEALAVSGADEFVRELPDGLDTRLGEKGLGLSEGQVQRLAIARALLSGAPVLLLDEATSALDERTERELLGRLRGLKTRTVVIISHRRAVLEVCDHHIDIDMP